jgi:hypothetical protein
MILQLFKARDVARVQEKYNVPNRTLAALWDISEPMISLFKSGQRGLSREAQSRGFLVLRFIKNTAEDSALPVDFSQTERMVELFERYRQRYDEDQVICLAHEHEATQG